MRYSSLVEEVGEPVKAVASFDDGRIKLHHFCWRERIYRVERFNLLHRSRNGAAETYHFAVSAHGNDYQISFDPISLAWQLERLCVG